MSSTKFYIAGSRLANSSRTWLAGEDVAYLAGYPIETTFIVAGAIETASKTAGAGEVRLRFRKKDTGSFVEVSLTSGAVRFTGSGPLLDGDPVDDGDPDPPDERGCAPSGSQAYQEGQSLESESTWPDPSLAANCWTEFHFQLEFNNGDTELGADYEFELFDYDANASIGTLAAYIRAKGGYGTDSRAIRTSGHIPTTPDTDSRAIRTKGHEEDDDSRAVRTHGHEEDNDSRAIRTSGSSGATPDTDSRAIRTWGFDTDDDSRAIRTHGHEPDDDSRAIRTHGLDTDEDSRALRTIGHEPDDDSRAIRTTGHQIDSDSRSLKTWGLGQDDDDRALRTAGHVPDDDSRAIRTYGAGVDSDYRALRTAGTAVPTGVPTFKETLDWIMHSLGDMAKKVTRAEIEASMADISREIQGELGSVGSVKTGLITYSESSQSASLPTDLLRLDRLSMPGNSEETFINILDYRDIGMRKYYSDVSRGYAYVLGRTLKLSWVVTDDTSLTIYYVPFYTAFLLEGSTTELGSAEDLPQVMLHTALRYGVLADLMSIHGVTGGQLVKAERWEERYRKTVTRARSILSIPSVEVMELRDY